MKKFFKHDWKTLRSINLMDCEIRDQDWRIFIENAHKMPNLREIKICKLFIECEILILLQLYFLVTYKAFLLFKVYCFTVFIFLNQPMEDGLIL